MSFRSDTGRSRSPLRAAFLACACAAAAFVAGGCHLDMYDQPKFKPLAPDPFFADGASARPLVEGTVARGHADTNEYRLTGKSGSEPGSGFPFPVTMAVLNRGRDRFETFCSPCHGRLADGNGMVVRRGFPRPPSLLADSIRTEPEGFFFDVITEGFGRMYSYAPSIPVDDRWNVVAYVRALQFRSNVPVQDLPPSDRARLAEGREGVLRR